MAGRIDTVDARTKLKPRRSPYWHKLSNGCHLGFRKMTTGSSGAWLAQYYDADTRKQTRRSLVGPFDALPESQRFDAAKREAEEWFKHLGMGGTLETVTVKKACEAYVEHIRATNGNKKADDIEARFRRWVDAEKIALVELPKLGRPHVEAWRKKMAKTPVLANPHAKKVDQRSRERSPSSINRDMTPLRAALNYAHDNAQVIGDIAWRVALRPIKNADKQRGIYLDLAQRRRLIAECPDDMAKLLRALSLIPLRPGALAALTVAKFDARLGVLAIGKDKAQCKGKLLSSPLLTRADGKAWGKDDWKGPIKVAAHAAELPPETVLYALRHSAITDLVVNGLDLLTVAQLSGTSVAMIEKHYGHLRADHAAAALALLTL